ncbi:MAG: hypothetical protein ACRDQ2_02485 [Gaiellales bacterium]
MARAWFSTNEILTTLMLNFVALLFMEYLIFGSLSPWRDVEVTTFPRGVRIGDAYLFPRIGWTRLHLGFFLGVLFAILLHLGLTRTGFGYKLSVAAGSVRIVVEVVDQGWRRIGQER